jgi:hypothetical protein
MPVPVTTTRTDHAISIRVDGETIGQIQDWTPQQSRTITATYELKSDTSGEVVENVPGNIGGLTLGVNRFDLYKAKMEEVWGTNFNIQMLTDQTEPFTVQEKWLVPNDSPEIWIYTGCWFSSLGRNHSAQGDRITKVNASLSYVKKYRVS